MFAAPAEKVGAVFCWYDNHCEKITAIVLNSPMIQLPSLCL
jgi:hypothetical protein